MAKRKDRDPLAQKKSLGQVFLKEEWPVRRMAEILRDQGIVRVVEIGPGGGALTRELLAVGLQVDAVEKDERFAAHLAGLAPLWQERGQGRLRIISDDILDCDLAALLAGDGRDRPDQVALVGNIPYNISSPIVLRALEHLHLMGCMLIMTQLEFARRLAAAPNSKDYGSLTVFAQLRTQVTLEFEVGKDCFQPIPKVDSAVVRLSPLKASLPSGLLASVERLTRMAFAQRRKKLRNSIQRLLSESVAPGGLSLEESPVDLDRRADAVTPQEFVAMARWLAGSRSIS